MDDVAGNGREAILVLVALVAAGYDVRFRRIPSWLTVPGIAAGLVFGAMTSTPRQFALLLAVAALTFAAGFLLFVTSILGGGDGKLLTCVAALAGPEKFAECLVWMLIAGVVFSIAILAWSRALLPWLGRLGRSVAGLLRFGIAPDPMGEHEPHRMPFAIVVLAGGIAAIAARHAGVTLLP